jgi:hypothetical protein
MYLGLQYGMARAVQIVRRENVCYVLRGIEKVSENKKLGALLLFVSKIKIDTNTVFP